ncbi:MAG: alpha-E domain-containing protein [Caldimonas sp.]
MLSRTADHLFWMARYMERAENTARMLDVNYQMSLLPQSVEAAEKGWKGLLSISELSGDYAKRHGAVTPRGVMDYMVGDPKNGSSIRSCLMAARENARAVRGTLTTEVWETQNQTWLEFQRMVATNAFERTPSDAFEWVKFRSHLSRGVTVGTMLQDEAFHFLRIGSFLERADNTARLLDVKFHAVETEFFGPGLGPRIGQSQGANGQVQSLGGMTQSQGFAAAEAGAEGSAAANGNGNGRDIEYDFYHWSAILRSVSGFEVYRKVYRNVIRPEKVAELLILRADMPRSLAACMQEVMSNLHFVANEQSKDTLRLAGRLRADLQYGRIDEILATGLHAFLTQFLERVNTLGVGISRDFLVPVAA